MRIRITRRGGFAGMTFHREIDTANLATPAADAVQQLAEAAIANHAAPQRMPDAFEYEIDVDGRTFVVSGDEPAWRALIEQVGVQ